MIYDPLVDKTLPSNLPKPDSHWADGRDGEIYPRLNNDINTDVAIVGGGFTGLSTALHLRHQYGIDCVVLEANQPGFGASGRNGGFVLPGTGRLSHAQCTARFGADVTADVYREYHDAVAFVDALIDGTALPGLQRNTGILCERTEGGYLKLAHQQRFSKQLHQQAQQANDAFGDRAIAVSESDVKSQYLSGVKSYGGVYFPRAFSVNPWLLVQGVAKLATKAGVSIYGGSPVIQHQSVGNMHELMTAHGSVRAKTLVIASNAYTPRAQFSVFRDKTFPVISSIMVTKPLSAAQLASISMRPGLMVMDTRPLKYYYRLLPDNRLLFGGRGAITGKNADLPRYKAALLNGLNDTLPQLKGIDVDKFWSGWVAISYDDYPRTFLNRGQGVMYSAGYCGAGLAFSLHAGKRLAQLYAEPDALPNLPFWQSPLSTFPMPALRRTALRAFYLYEKSKDWLKTSR